jgi:hypothetical protein
VKTDDTVAGGASAGDETTTTSAAPASPAAPATTDAAAKPPVARGSKKVAAAGGPAVPEGHPLRAFFHALKDFLVALPPPEHNLGVARDELVKATHELLGIK